MHRFDLPPRSLRQLGYLSMTLLLSTCPVSVWAKAPHVEFDMPVAVACHDVTTEAFHAEHPNARLIRADFEVSAFRVEGDEADIIEQEYRFVSRGRQMRVFAYEPRTTLTSDYTGGIQLEEKAENTRSAGVTVSGAWDHLVKATGSSDIGSKNTNIKRYELVAPREPVASSGTIFNGSGVSIKLRPSRTTTLEGAKAFSVTWRVPADWRADVLEVVCAANGYDRGVVKQFDERVLVGGEVFRVALYAAGDQAAHSAGEELVMADRRLRLLAAANQDDIRRRRYPTVVHEIGGLLDVVKPKISDGWLAQLTSTRTPRIAAQTYRRLPAPVRAAASDYMSARMRFEATVAKSR